MKSPLMSSVRLAAALSVSLLAAACGSEEKEPTSTDGSLRGTITVAAAGGGGEIGALKDMAAAFENAHPGTTVVVDGVDAAGELTAKLATAFAAGSPPDVFVINYRRMGAIAAKDVIQPPPADATDGLYPGPLSAFTFDGRLLCRPSNASSMVVYLNIALFARAGVPVPEKDWTWDDMLGTAKALKAKGIKAIGFETGLIRLAPFVWSNGGEIVDSTESPTSVDLSAAPAKEAVQFLLDLQETGLSATDRAAQDPEDAFSAGKVAMFLDSRRAVPGLRKTEGLAFDVVGVPTKKTAVSVLHSDAYCVSKAGKNKALADAFSAYAVTGPGAVVLAESGRTVPVKQSVAESPAFLAPGLAPAHAQVFLDQVGALRPLPHVPTWNEAEGVTEEILTQLFAGKITLDKAIVEIAAQTKVELAKS